MNVNLTTDPPATTTNGNTRRRLRMTVPLGTAAEWAIAVVLLVGLIHFW